MESLPVQEQRKNKQTIQDEFNSNWLNNPKIIKKTRGTQPNSNHFKQVNILTIAIIIFINQIQTISKK